jgi:hypothetical protein
VRVGVVDCQAAERIKAARTGEWVRMTEAERRRAVALYELGDYRRCDQFIRDRVGVVSQDDWEDSK